ncbi:DNA-directed RNA polymerase subunit omega [Oscillibacter valericigenes]|nr:DNA-directed RNA polymerase subunit omega [Oscillibacter valericigenes]
MMLYPAMNTLIKNVPNRYLLVNVVARRARQIAEDAEMEEIHLTEKPVTEAINEVADGRISAADIDTRVNK